MEIQDIRLLRKDGGKSPQQLVDDALTVGKGVLLHMEQARCAALGKRGLRHQFGRQVEIVVGECVHAMRWVSEQAWNCYGYRFVNQAAMA